MSYGCESFSLGLCQLHAMLAARFAVSFSCVCVPCWYGRVYREQLSSLPMSSSQDSGQGFDIVATEGH